MTLWRDLYAAADDVDQPVNGQTDPDYRWFFCFVRRRTIDVISVLISILMTPLTMNVPGLTAPHAEAGAKAWR